MLSAIFNLILGIAMIACMVLWIIVLVDSDGSCHFEDCEHCPFYPGDCPESRRKHEGEDDG